MIPSLSILVPLWLHETIKDALEDVIKGLFEGATDLIVRPLLEAIIELLIQPVLRPILQPVERLMTYVPAPETGTNVMASPQNEPWITIFGDWWGWMVPLGLALLVVSYLVSEALSDTGLTDETAARQREYGLVVGLFAIPLSRYVITLFLQLMQLLTREIRPGDGLDVARLAQEGGIVDAVLGLVIVAMLSLVVYIAVILVHLVRIAAIVLLTAAAPLLLAFMYGQFPVIGTYSKKLLKTLPVLAFVSVLTALALRLMTVLTEDGSVILFTSFAEPAASFLNAMFLLTPGLIGIMLPITVLRSMDVASAPSARGMQYSTGNAATRRASKKAGSAKQAATEKGHREVERRTRLGRGTTDSNALPDEERGQQAIAREAAAITDETGVDWSAGKTERELQDRMERGESLADASDEVRQKATAAAEGGQVLRDETVQRAAARRSSSIKDATNTPWTQSKIEHEIVDRVEDGQQYREAVANTRAKAAAAESGLGDPDEVFRDVPDPNAVASVDADGAPDRTASSREHDEMVPQPTGSQHLQGPGTTTDTVIAAGTGDDDSGTDTRQFPLTESSGSAHMTGQSPHSTSPSGLPTSGDTGDGDRGRRPTDDRGSTASRATESDAPQHSDGSPDSGSRWALGSNWDRLSEQDRDDEHPQDDDNTDTQQ